MRTLARTLCLALATIVLFSAGSPTQMVGAQENNSDIEWSDPHRVGNQDAVDWFPEIDADAAGNVRIVWESTRIPLDDDGQPVESASDAVSAAFLLTSFSEGDWSTPSDIYVKDVYNAGRPIIVSGPNYMHLLGRALRAGDAAPGNVQNLGSLYYMRAPLASDLTNPHSWSDPVAISSQASYWARVVVLPDDRLVVLYNETTVVTVGGEPAISTRLMSRGSPDAGMNWERPVPVSRTTAPVSRSSAVVTDESGSLLACWDEGYDNMSGQTGPMAISTARSHDGGATWVDIGSIDSADSTSTRRSDAIQRSVEQCELSSNGETTMIVYRSTVNPLLLYRVSSDGGRTWSAEMQVPHAEARPYGGPHHFDRLTLATDGDGSYLLAFVGSDTKTRSGVSVMLVSYTEGTWSKPQVIGRHAGYPEYPRLAISLGNQLFVTYFVRDELFSDTAARTMWAVQGSSDAEEVEPVESMPVSGMGTGGGAAVVSDGATAARVEVYAAPEPPPFRPVGSSAVDSEVPRATLTSPFARTFLITAAAVLVCAVLVIGVRGYRLLRF